MDIGVHMHKRSTRAAQTFGLGKRLDVMMRRTSGSMKSMYTELPGSQRDTQLKVHLQGPSSQEHELLDLLKKEEVRRLPEQKKRGKSPKKKQSKK